MTALHDVDLLDPGERRGAQLAQLGEQLARVGARSDLYREVFSAAGFRPERLTSLEDLHVLPLTTKQDHVDALARRRPWGDHLACDPADIRRVHFSSGTTSQPTPVCWTSRDLERWDEMYARGATSFGVSSADVYQCLFSFPWFVGGLGTHRAFEGLGVTAIPGGSAEARRQIETILRFDVTLIGGTPSFVFHLTEVAAEMGVDLTGSAVRRILLGGEVGAGVPATRAVIEERWGARCFDGYGTLEFQPIAWECEHQRGGHLFEDLLYAEVLDPTTHEPVPDGQPGLLVVTHLDKEAHPFVRWNTGDIVIRDQAPCSCGRTTARLVGGVLGRSDDMLVVRGINLYPSAVEDVIRGTIGTTGEYRVLAGPSHRDPVSGILQRVGIQVEVVDGTDREAIAGDVASRVLDQLRVHADVEALAPGTLARTTHKAKRLERS